VTQPGTNTSGQQSPAPDHHTLFAGTSAGAAAVQWLFQETAHTYAGLPGQKSIFFTFFLATPYMHPLLWSAQTGSAANHRHPENHQIHSREWLSGTRAEFPEFFCIFRSLLQRQLLQHRDGNSPPLITPHFGDTIFVCHEKLFCDREDTDMTTPTY